MRKTDPTTRLFKFLTALAMTFLVNAPILLVILNSFRSTSAIMINGSSFKAQDFTLDNYFALFRNSQMVTFIWNSLFVTVVGTGISILISSLAGYILSRYRYKLVTIYSYFLLMIQMFPLILSLIPLFVLFKKLGIINTHLSVIIVYITTSLPFATWMFKGFFDSIPKELEEAAWIDGCSKPGVFRRIILPISGPGIIAVSIFTFLLCWNEYLIANIFLRKSELMTIPVGIQMFIQQFSTEWGQMFAAATMAMVPALIIFVFFQKYVVSGVAAGGVKG